MSELILSDITVMGQGYCVIGLEQGADGSIKSVRPRPPYAFSWREPFQFARGDAVECRLKPPPQVRLPHKEDMDTFGLESTPTKISQSELVHLLERAERASILEELFGCMPQRDNPKGNFWVRESEGKRSICGCRYANVYFEVYSDERWSLRARMLAEGNQRFNTLPVVDREWVRYLHRVVGLYSGADRREQVKHHINRVAYPKLMRSALKFARIGLARANQGKCWVMLDSLFPQPEESWLAQPAPRAS
jgi:hypothetical protein